MAVNKNNLAEADAQAVLQQRLAESNPENEDGPSVVTSNGWTKVENTDLPTKGRFYREVWVKPLDVKTVREVSSVDPNDVKATLKGMCTVLKSNCYIIDLNGNKVEGSKLKRADSLTVLLIIRAITYENDFKINLAQPVRCPHCGEAIKSIETDGAAVLPWPEKLDEIATIDDEGNMLYKSFKFHLPSVEEVHLFITVYLSEDPKMKLDDVTRGEASSLLYIIPEVHSALAMYREIIKASSEMYGKSLADIAAFHKFSHFLDVNVGIEPTIDTECPNCHSEVKIPFSMGLSDLVFPSDSDF